MTRVICIGECMVELRATAENTFERAYAGDAYNTAVYLKRSLPDAQVQFLTAVGDDATSRAMRNAWVSEGIDDTLAFTVEGGLPGLYLIETDSRGERRFQYWRSNSAARRWVSLLQAQGESVLWGADLVYFSGIALAILNPNERSSAIELLRRVRTRVGRIAFDPNVRLALWETAQIAAETIESALSMCDIALPSSEDIARLFHLEEPGQQANLLLAMGVRELALTLGSSGCLVVDGEVRTRLPAPAVDMVADTSGAGDAFNGAYLATRLRGGSAQGAAQAGLMVGSRVVTHAGAIVPKSISHPHDPGRSKSV
jgi:2-dehydro-3-deoxygluconokinase